MATKQAFAAKTSKGIVAHCFQDAESIRVYKKHGVYSAGRKVASAVGKGATCTLAKSAAKKALSKQRKSR